VPHHSQLYTAVVDVGEPHHDHELEFCRSATAEPLPRFDHPEYHGSDRATGTAPS
jgi:hypothetical protein